MPRFTCCIGTGSLPRNGAGDNSILNHEKHEAHENFAAHFSMLIRHYKTLSHMRQSFVSESRARNKRKLVVIRVYQCPSVVAGRVRKTSNAPRENNTAL